MFENDFELPLVIHGGSQNINIVSDGKINVALAK
jgi:hypothetical protein